MKLNEIAERIYAHLKRMEADPKINYTELSSSTPKRFYRAYAYTTGKRLAVVYKSYQLTPFYLSKRDAITYTGRLLWIGSVSNDE